MAKHVLNKENQDLFNVQVHDTFDSKLRLQPYLIMADLDNLPCEYEDWEIQGSSAELSYLSHGFFRFFGKFPPPVAKRFIEELHDASKGPIVDPMMGSGTTLVEAMLHKRKAVGLDVNPLAVLVAKVKTTPISYQKIQNALEKYQRFYAAPSVDEISEYIPQDKYLNHWFFPEVQIGIARTRFFIDMVLTEKDISDFFKLALAAIIRNLSRASKGLGRMFLDPALQPQNVQEQLSKKVLQMGKVCDSLEHLKPDIKVLLNDAREEFLEPRMTNLVICHPPYFNLYKYSSIYKYEMLWLGYDYFSIKKQEIREGFKIGKKEIVNHYVDDLMGILRNINRVLIKGGWCVFMMGDTVLRGERINTTALTIRRIESEKIGLRLNKVIIRHPKFTEASYAATQRRTKTDVGIKLQDHILILKKTLRNDCRQTDR